MFRSPLRAFAVLVVSLTLTTPLCEAASPGSAPGRARQAAATPSHLLGLWDWLASVLAKNGCSIDPSGRCVNSPTPTGQSLPPVPSLSDTDEGCAIDPGGRNCHVIL